MRKEKEKERKGGELRADGGGGDEEDKRTTAASLLCWGARRHGRRVISTDKHITVTVPRLMPGADLGRLLWRLPRPIRLSAVALLFALRGSMCVIARWTEVEDGGRRARMPARTHARAAPLLSSAAAGLPLPCCQRSPPALVDIAWKCPSAFGCRFRLPLARHPTAVGSGGAATGVGCRRGRGRGRGPGPGRPAWRGAHASHRTSERANERTVQPG